jgi:hypothetical protein
MTKAKQPIYEKIEGVTFGPKLSNGDYALVVITDNDFSVTQNDSGTQLDVCTNGEQVAMDSGCPKGSTLIPTLLYSFRVNASNYIRPKTQK